MFKGVNKMLKKLQWTIGLVAFLLLVNLVCTVVSLDHSFMYFISATDDNNASETVKDFKDSWAIRGQMGDILSGHFSALAFLAVAFSILLQNEANRKMQTSIEKQDKSLEQQDRSLQQQSKALEVQSESLKAQIEELQQSRKESERQTEEFFIANMNVKLDRYYKMLDAQIALVINNKSVHEYIYLKELAKDSNDGFSEQYFIDFTRLCNEISSIIIILNQIMLEVKYLAQKSPQAYEDFMTELRIKVINCNILHEIKVSFNEPIKDSCMVFDEFFK